MKGRAAKNDALLVKSVAGEDLTVYSPRNETLGPSVGAIAKEGLERFERVF